MKKRVGNDIPFSWTLLRKPSGLPYDLTGETVTVNMKLSGQCIEIPMDCVVEVNVISFTYYGKDQPSPGKYDLLLRIFDAEGKPKVTYDVANVVELVPHSWLETDEGSIDIESEIATNGEVNVIEVVKVNGVALPVVDKAVDIAVPTDLADLAGDDTHRTVTDAEKAAWNAKYNKPASGIPASDLADGVIPDVSDFVDEDTLDAALEGKQDAIEDLEDIRAGAAAGATALQSFTETDPTVPAWAKQPNKPSYNYNEIGNTPDLSQFITKSVDDLVNYYLKSETYTKAEVQALVNAVKQFTYESVATLPTASAETMHKIYLVPSADPQTQNVKDEYITIDNGASAQTRYTWEQIGSTAIDLSGYVTTSALNTALASYTTTSDLTTLLAGKQDVISDLDTIRSGAAAGATAYQKPNGGIPKNDLASAVQTSLGKADSALQSESDPVFSASAAAGITAQDIQTWDAKSDFSGDYNDLSNKPSIPAAGIPSGGSAGQILAKNSSTNYDVKWVNAGAGGDVNVIEVVKVNGTALTPDANKAVDVPVPTALLQLSDDSTHRLVTDSEKTGWNNKSDFSGSYNDLSDKPTIPTVPVISTDIAADGSSDAKTASPKAVKTFVEGKGYGTYSKPSGGIPKTDLAADVQTSLGKADSALQSESDPIFSASAAAGITAQDIQEWNAKSDFSGDYNDLTNKPTIPTIESLTTSEIDSIWNAA